MLNKLSRMGFVTLFAGLSACGGGGGTPTVAIPSTSMTPVTVQVIDGPIQGAVVCLDTNNNGVCDTSEPQATTDLTGKATFSVDPSLVGKYPVVAMIGTNAVDTVNGPVTTAYVMSAPADQAAVVTPLTTLVQQTVANSGSTTAAAALAIQNATGISVSLFVDPATIGTNAVNITQMLVLTSQSLASTLAPAVGQTALDGSIITAANIIKLVQQQILNNLPSVVTSAVSGTPSASAANTIVTNAGITSASAQVLVAANNQAAATTTIASSPAAFAKLRQLNFQSAGNYFFQQHTATMAQDTPDSNGNIQYIERYVSGSNGNISKWRSGGTKPQADQNLFWNGTAWVGCALNSTSVSGPKDSAGNSSFSFCNGWVLGASNSAVFDVSGQSMLNVYNQAIASGYTNLTISNASSVLGSTAFPANSHIQLNSSTVLASAIAYYQGDPTWDDFSDIVSQYTSAVNQGGVAANQPANTLCNSSESNDNGANSTSFDLMIPAKHGTPCLYPGGWQFTYGGVTYTAPTNIAWWGNSSLRIGVVGSALVNSGTYPGFFNGNQDIRLAFTGGNSVTYYTCQQKFTGGGPWNCTSIGTGTYTIATLGDSRVMTFANLPTQTSSFKNELVLVERSGHVYRGFRNKLTTNNSFTFDTTAGNALLTQLGITPEDPTLPFSLSSGSYQGYYDLTSATGNYMQLVLNADGTSKCVTLNGSPKLNATTWTQSYACVITITNASTGAISTSVTATSGATPNTGIGTITVTNGAITLTTSDGQTWTGYRS